MAYAGLSWVTPAGDSWINEWFNNIFARAYKAWYTEHKAFDEKSKGAEAAKWLENSEKMKKFYEDNPWMMELHYDYATDPKGFKEKHPEYKNFEKYDPLLQMRNLKADTLSKTAEQQTTRGKLKSKTLIPARNIPGLLKHLIPMTPLVPGPGAEAAEKESQIAREPTSFWNWAPEDWEMFNYKMKPMEKRAQLIDKLKREGIDYTKNPEMTLGPMIRDDPEAQQEYLANSASLLKDAEARALVQKQMKLLNRYAVGNDKGSRYLNKAKDEFSNILAQSTHNPSVLYTPEAKALQERSSNNIKTIESNRRRQMDNWMKDVWGTDPQGKPVLRRQTIFKDALDDVLKANGYNDPKWRQEIINNPRAMEALQEILPTVNETYPIIAEMNKNTAIVDTPHPYDTLSPEMKKKVTTLIAKEVLPEIEPFIPRDPRSPGRAVTDPAKMKEAMDKVYAASVRKAAENTQPQEQPEGAKPQDASVDSMARDINNKVREEYTIRNPNPETLEKWKTDPADPNFLKYLSARHGLVFSPDGSVTDKSGRPISAEQINTLFSTPENSWVLGALSSIKSAPPQKQAALKQEITQSPEEMGVSPTASVDLGESVRGALDTLGISGVRFDQTSGGYTYNDKSYASIDDLTNAMMNDGAEFTADDLRSLKDIETYRDKTGQFPANIRSAISGQLNWIDEPELPEKMTAPAAPTEQPVIETPAPQPPQAPVETPAPEKLEQPVAPPQPGSAQPMQPPAAGQPPAAPPPQPKPETPKPPATNQQPKKPEPRSGTDGQNP